MPLEIKELYIKANLGGNQENAGSGSQSGSVNNEKAIINACVDKILKILKDKSER